MAWDQIKLTSHLHVNKQPFVMVEKLEELHRLKTDGVCGLGFWKLDHDNPNIMLNLYQKGIIDFCVFSFYLSWDIDEHGEPLSEIILGGYDKKYMAEEKFHYTKIVDSRFWSIGLEGMKINEKNFELVKYHNALIDSGSSLLHVPKIYFDILLNQMVSAGIHL